MILASAARDDRPRVVLDTNVCLDLFVFDDPRVSPVREALQAGAIEAVTDAGCREEWQRVLAYPQLQLDANARAAALVAFDGLVRECAITQALSLPLPRCADPDDQKFLQLAAAAGARWLLSRDDALLKLARRTRRDGLFEIVTPADWATAWRAAN